MDKISINSLFAPTLDRPLDVQTLAIQYNPTKAAESISIRTLKELKKNKEKILKNHYEQILRLCYTRMRAAAKIGRYELSFQVPSHLTTESYYRHGDCIRYIQKRLIKVQEKEKIELGVKRTAKDTLLISWA